MSDRLAQALLLPINITGPIIMGLYTFLWGLWVASPMWDVFSRAPLYDSMGAIAPEWVWGTVAIVVGIAMIYGVCRRHFTVLTYSALAAAWVWTAIAVFYFAADWMSTGGITSLMITAYNVFIYLNVKVNYFIPTRNNRKGGNSYVEEQ